MRNLLIAITLILLGAVVSSLVQPQAHAQRSVVANSFKLLPQVMPSSLTDIATLTGGPPASHDVYVCYMDVETKGTASSYTIQDKQGTPVPLAYQESIAANSTYAPLVQSAGSNQGCRWFPGGMSVQAGGSSQVWMYLSGYYY